MGVEEVLGQSSESCVTFGDTHFDAAFDDVVVEVLPDANDVALELLDSVARGFVAVDSIAPQSFEC